MPRGVSCYGAVLASYSFIAALSSLAFFVLAILIQIFIWPFYNIKHQEVIPPENIYTSPLPSLLWILIGISILAILSATIGCLCFINLRTCGILCVALILTGLIISEEIVVKKCYDERDETINQIKSNLNGSLIYYPNVTQVTDFWNLLQSKLECCGIDGPEDWNEVYGSLELPLSCCSPSVPSVNFNCTSGEPGVSNMGCGRKIEKAIEDKSVAIYAITISLIIIQAIATVVCLILCCCLGQSRIIMMSDYMPI